MLTLDDLDTHEGLLKYHALCVQHEACEAPMIYTEAAIANGWTLQELLDNVRIDHPLEYREWARWIRISLVNDMDRFVRLRFVKMGFDDPKTAKAGLINLNKLSLSEEMILKTRTNKDIF